MITIRPFLPGDMELIEARDYEREMMNLAGNSGTEFAQRGPAFTMLDDGQPVMAAGVYLFWDGVGEAWMHLSPWFYRHVKIVYRHVGEILASIIIRKSLRRVQCPIRADSPANIRFVEHLGFTQEGLLRRWGPDGRDYIMFAMVAPEGESLCQLRR